MGTSSRRPSIISPEQIEKTKEFIKSRNGTKLADLGARIVLPFLPNGQTKAPIYYSISYGIKILKYSQKELTKDVVLEGFRREIVKRSAKELSNYAWDHIEDYLIKEKIERPLVKFSERAFDQTVTEILINGADAI